MTHVDRTGSGWRVRWAKRENARRRRAHEDAVEAWCLRGVALQRLRAAAEDPPTIRPALPLDLAPDETVVAVQPSTGLVTVPRHADLPHPELSAIPVAHPDTAPPMPEGSRVTDAGTAVVTDRRILLVSRKRIHEWTYGQLGGLTHHPAVPVTLLYGPNGALVAGLRLPRGAAARFRLRLTMAYADATGQRDAVLTRLDDAVVASRRLPPAAPVLVSATQAPGYHRLTRPAVAAGVALVALAAFAAMTGSDPTGHPPTARPTDGPVVVTTTPGADTSIGPAASSAPAVDPAAPGRVAPRPAPAGLAGGTFMPPPADRRAPLPSDRATTRVPPDAEPTGRVPTPGGVPAPTRAPTASPTPAPSQRCGAPENPLGYTYCGGSLIHEPAAEVCSYFVCVDGFWAGRGYLTRCGDGTVGMVGGRYGSCPDRTGRKQPVYGTALHGGPAGPVGYPSAT
ncbi:hypothetical protein [Micromonospora purpureochromogenes]|uniref:Uncharacterized protein n=1 Tax=Micromonospora purpureochromogenes TaxID=47872 RepID=A0ABX2RPM5_9ACTN|nr:hypothetical protein [Micromonospora purpureochromogenes]NYF57163.1 hypothetical protein [Micromonospora purpureochromogenes]